MPAVTIFDTGTSQLFITYDLADQLQATLLPLQEPLTTVDFGGQKFSITHTVQLSLRLLSIAREWTFYVSRTAPAPIVLGLDLVLEWPLFLNPQDKRLYVLLASSASMQTSCGFDARCLQQPVINIFTEVQAEVVPQLPFSSDEVIEPTDDFLSGLSFNPKMFAVECTYRNSVTASGFAKAEELTNFMESLPVDLRKVVDEFIQIF